MAKEIKKANKKTLGAVFCALSLGVAGVTGLMLNDANKKYDELKKDNTVQVEQYKTEKTALQTQLEQKQAQLEQLQSDATANATQIAQLESEVESLENQLEQVDYINKTIEDADVSYAYRYVNFCTADSLTLNTVPNSFWSGNEYNVVFQNIDFLDVIDSYNLNINGVIQSVGYHIDSLEMHETTAISIQFKDLNNNDLTIKDTDYCRCVSSSIQYEIYSQEELQNLNITNKYDGRDILKNLNLTIVVEIME